MLWRIFALTVCLSSITINEINAYSFPLTSTDARTANYLRQEENVWQTFPKSNLSESIQIIYNTHSFNLDFNQGILDQILSYNEELAQNITELNRTATRVLELIRKRRSTELQNLAEISIRSVPTKLTYIFAEVKRIAFQRYLTTNSDPCQTQSQLDAPFALDGITQNVATDVYKTVLESLTKGYMVCQLSYMLLVANGEVKYKKDAIALRTTFTNNYRNFEQETTRILNEEKYLIWNCDDYRLNSSYTQITNLWQGYIDNEVNISPNGSCKGDCDDFTFTKNFRCDEGTLCAPNYLDKNKTICEGEVRDCSFIESDMWICPNEDDEEPGRRYNYIRYASGRVLGKPTFCPQEIQLKSWNRWFVECSFCFCFCDTTGPNTDRYFSLREALANISDNRVVTGLQLVKNEHIIHLAISERQLRPNGGIHPTDRSSTTWISNFNFRVNDSDTVEDIDYHRLTVRNSAIDLDVLHVPAGHVLTGARFRIVNAHIRFEIRATQFNFETGLLDQGKSKTAWIGNNNRNKKRIFEPRADVPTRTPKISMRDRTTDTYVEFGFTDIEKDMAQTTIPFIETLPVEAHNPTILSGAGIYYKSQPGYGGFIAPLVITFNENLDKEQSIQYL